MSPESSLICLREKNETRKAVIRRIEWDKTMLNIKQLRYGTDNFSYLLYGKTQAVAVDGGAWKEILDFLKQNNLMLKIVTNTHSHYDHTPGNDHLLQKTGAEFIRAADFQDHQPLVINAERILVYRTPGHTDDSVCFHAGSFLITGDTLFNGTVGNCFSGNMNIFFLSIKRLMDLSGETMIYAGHDYILNALAFARHLEPRNKNIDLFRNACRSRNTTYSTLDEERGINPYLRFNEESIIHLLRKNNLPHATEQERWNSLMSLE
ncbi:MAG: Hydroxyacylglutathione hydrolase [Deltaproteobacteria bacterium ADurb.Bin022]|jgi:hydroxyacylglutathione hydrolase|nr:MAG: Hydroxyacylglutathione hydrolase [Deltaproteobacteria bacterium ADurb.Bin022]